ncbi:MAG: FAD-dependent oxidoreductase [Firmicutes bacterium]|nr:FAD-dependent oxidoreductase [Bacillota bacterium]
MVLSQKINGDTIHKKVSHVDFSDSYDVIVAGLGTAGSLAAVCSARAGLRVAGVERLTCMGGIGTAGGIMAYYFGSKGGFYEEIDRMSKNHTPSVYTKPVHMSIDAKKYVLEDSALGFGADIKYESTVTGVYFEGKTVKGINLLTPHGTKAIACKVLIDCTGDAYVCDIAGCSSRWGRDIDGRTQPFTSVRVHTRNGIVRGTNFDSGYMKQCDPQQLSSGIIISHAAHLNRKGDKGSHPLYFAPLIGVREGRRVEGEETVTLPEFFDDKMTKQPVFYAYADLDKHGLDFALDSEILQDWAIASNLGAVNISIPIPMGSFIPKGYDGLLVAGRCMSFDRDISSCVRMMRDMQKTGEVAAAIADISIKTGCALRDVPYGDLLPRLKETGCFDESNNKGYVFDIPTWIRLKNPELKEKKITWLTDADAIKAELATLTPGAAIWSCRRLGENIRQALCEWLGSTDENLRKHSAFALALIGDRVALPVLRSMIRTREDVILQDCRKNNQMRGVMAIYLAGKLCDKEIINDLIDIILDSDGQKKSAHTNAYAELKHNSEEYNNIYFQFFSFSLIALISIGNTYQGLRAKIKKAITAAFEDERYIDRITSKKNVFLEYDMIINLRKVVERETTNW